MLAIVSFIFAITIPLVTFAYKAPESYSVFKRDCVKYLCITWFLTVFVVMTAWLLEKLGWIKVLVEKNIIFELIDAISGADIFLLVVIFPTFIWVLLELIGKVAKYRKT